MGYSRFTFTLIIASSLGSLTYGFTSGLGGSVPGLPGFITYFDYLSDSHIADTFQGVYAGGGIIGIISGGIISEKFGRKKAIFTGSFLGVIGGALMSGAQNLAMLYISRFIAGMSIGMCVMLVPIWQTEISPAHGRGALVALHGVMILLGYSLSMWSSYGFYFLDDPVASWRIPMALQIIWPLALCFVIWWLPESPRYLLEMNHIEEARNVMNLIDPNTNDQSFRIMLEQFASESQLSSWSSFVTHPPNRKRLLVGFLIMFSAQSTGDLTVTNYGPTLYRNLGFDSKSQVMLSAIYISTAIFYNYIASLLLDRLGRKLMMFIGLFGNLISVIGLTIMLALFSASENVGGNRATVFFLFLRLLFYGTFLDATTYVYSVEIWPTHLRSRGSSLSFLGMFISMLAYITPVTTALNNIKWKFYIVFICLTAINCVVVWLYFPETKNLTLEEIGEKFGDYDFDRGLLEVSKSINCVQELNDLQVTNSDDEISSKHDFITRSHKLSDNIISDSSCTKQ